MTITKYNLLTLAAFLISAVAEFFVRDGGGFTLTAFIFYGFFHLIRTGFYLLKMEQDDDRESRLRERS